MEQILWYGYMIVYFCVGIEYYMLVLYFLVLCVEFGWSVGMMCMLFGMWVNDYDQLKFVLEFFQDVGVEIWYLLVELMVGIDYLVFVIDLEGYVV